MPLRTFLEHGLTFNYVDYEPIPFMALMAPKDLGLFDAIGAAMSYMLTPEQDANDWFIQSLGSIGLSIGIGFQWQSLDDSILAGLRRAAPVVTQIIDERWSSISDTVNGWRGTLAAGRASYDWALNAANAKYQIGTELTDQVIYVNTVVYANYEPLSGAGQYRLHFTPGQSPPVAGMWNLAMYDDAMFFVANDEDRFTIGSTIDGLAYNEDGSLTIVIQHDRPADNEVSNWLPAPAGPLNLTMRFYGPLASLMDKSYVLPAVEWIA